MVTNEEEIVSALQQCTKGEEVFVQDDVPTKDGPENFGGYDCGYVQQGVSSSFEFDYIPCAFLNLLVQITDTFYVDLATVRPDLC